jgi:hypothetical protein
LTVVIMGLVGWLVASNVFLVLIYRRAFFAAWREPVLRAPVLILESDDWGYGPLLQAERLGRLADVLARFRDSAGRHPVVTLGIVLAGPDGDRMRDEDCKIYQRLTLADSRLASVREALLRGTADGVFALQLHGMEHFWPASVMRSAARDVRVREWLTASSFASTEELPSPLQSRWVDASVLPSTPLPESEARAAAAEETRAFADVLGVAAEVVVPATFVWTDAVESAWIGAGVRVVVTPGLRNESRDAKGGVVAGTRTYFNAEIGPEGATYVVRDVYFEPAIGQTHAQAITALSAKTRTARPALIEMHRANFIGGADAAQRALEELEKLLRTALVAFPSLRFMSTAELVQGSRGGRSALVDTRLCSRLHFVIRRLGEVSRLRKLSWATGAAVIAWPAYMLTRPDSPSAAA